MLNFDTFFTNKKLLGALCCVFLCLLMVNLVAADGYNFDNIKDFDELTKTVTVKNSFLFVPTSDVADLQLKTPQIKNVIEGRNRIVAEFNVNFREDEDNVFNDMEFYYIDKGMKEFDRAYSWVYRELDYVDEVAIMGEAYRDKEGDVDGVEDWDADIIGYESVNIYKWTPIKDNTILKGEHVIGLQTDVYGGEAVEFIPTILGLRMPEFAAWNASFNVSLQSYYRFNTTSLVEPDVTRTCSLDVDTAAVASMVTPVLPNGRFMGASASQNNGLRNSSCNSFKGDYGTFCMWVANSYQSDACSGTQEFILGSNGGAHRFVIQADCDYGLRFNDYALIYNAGSTVWAADEWFFMCVRWDTTGAVSAGSDNYTFSENGIIKILATTDRSQVNNSVFYLGTNEGASNQDYTGNISELMFWSRWVSDSELVELYNGGVGLDIGATDIVSTAVTITYPTNTTYGSAVTTFNYTTDSDGSCWYSNDSGVTNSTFVSAGTNFTGLNYEEGNYGVRIYCNDSVNTEAFAGVFFTVDTTAPIVDIVLPVNNTQYITKDTTYNVTINATVSDAALNTCWYNNETANVTLTCGTNATINFTSGTHTVLFYANDSVNNVASDSVTFFINYVQDNLSYTNPEIEEVESSIYFNITAGNLTTLSANLTYNNTAYVMVEIYNNGTYGVMQYNVTTPAVALNTEVPLYVNYSLNGAAGETGLYNQTVLNITDIVISGTDCGEDAYNITFRDEQNLSILLVDYEYNFLFSISGSPSKRIYGKHLANNSLYICINSTISNNWTLEEGEIFYSGAGNRTHVERRYYFYEPTYLTNATQNLSIYDLIASAQTSFKLEIEDTSLNPYVANFTRLIRWYPDLNQYNTVDMGETDETGSTVIHVETEDVDYRIGVYHRNGTLIKLANPIRMVCLVTPCTYTLKISPEESDYTSFLNIDYTFTFNSTTNIWSFVYSDTTGITNTMNLTVYRDTGSSSYPICTSTVSGASGAITCNTTGYNGNLRGVVKRSASPDVVIASKLVSIFTSSLKSPFGLFLTLLIMIPIIFIFAIMSPILAIIGGVISLIPAWYFGSVSLTIVGGLAILGGIVIHFLKRIS